MPARIGPAFTATGPQGPQGPAGTPGGGGVIIVAAVDASTKWRNAADYLCDGTADEVQINAAGTAIGSVGDCLWLSPGTFTVAAPVVIQKDYITFQGCGRGATTILRSGGFAGSTMLTFNRDDITPLSRRPASAITVRDFFIDGIYGGTQGTTNGLQVKATDSTVRDVGVAYCNGWGIQVRGTPASESGRASDWNTYNTLIDHAFVHDCGQGGVYFDSASTDALGIITSFIDSNTGPGVELLGIPVEVSGNFIWGNRDQSVAGGSKQGNGILINSGVGPVNLLGNKIEQNRGGLRFIGGSGFQVLGNEFNSNSNAATGNTDAGSIHGGMPAGWYLAGATNERDDVMLDASGGIPTGVQFVANMINPQTHPSDQSRYAMNLLSGSQIEIGGNRIIAGTTGIINDVIGPTRSHIHHNQGGYVSEAAGTGTILSGTTSIAVTHGLSFTPVAQDIILTFSENPTNDPGNIWVSNLTSTQFTVNCRSNPGASNLDFGWRAQRAAYN